MTDLQVFAFIILPAVIVAAGGIITLLELRAQHAAHPAEPDLFLPEPRRRSMANSEGLGRRDKSSR